MKNKTNYVVHYKNLKLCESLGLKITQIRRGIKLKESAWLEEYINLNTRLRIEAKKSGNFEVFYFEVDFFILKKKLHFEVFYFEVDFFKLINNSVFGKNTIKY